MTTSDIPCHSIVDLLRNKTLKLFSYLEEIVGDDEKKRETIQDMRSLVVSASDTTLISYARYRFPNDTTDMRARIDTLCLSFGVTPDPVQLLRLLRFGSFFHEALYT